jgi:RNA polymerase sigma factor (sigma-70 family)
MNDEALVKAAQNGDDDAFLKLISNNKDKMFSIAYSYFKNEQDSLEAIQEVTCRAYLKLKKLKEIQYFSTWMIRIMINYCIDEKKRKNKIVLIDQSIGEAIFINSNTAFGNSKGIVINGNDDGSDNLSSNCFDSRIGSVGNCAVNEMNGMSGISDSERLDIEAAVELLESKYKKVIILKYFNDMTVPDIAKVMDCPEGTIKTWVFRALRQLRISLKVEQNGDREREVDGEGDFNV